MYTDRKKETYEENDPLGVRRFINSLVRAARFWDSRKERENDVVTCILNVVLVWADIRKGARIEIGEMKGSVERQRFLEELRRRFPADDPCLRLTWTTYDSKQRDQNCYKEPVLVNVKRQREKDLRVLAKHHGPDLEEPLVSAMGRALGYPCKYPADYAWNKGLREVGFWCEYTFVRLSSLPTTNNGKNGKTVDRANLAGFGCDGKRHSDKATREIMLRKEEEWVKPANALLGGRQFTLQSRDGLVRSRIRIVRFFMDSSVAL